VHDTLSYGGYLKVKVLEGVYKMHFCDRTCEKGPLDVKIDIEIKALEVRAHLK